MEVLRTHVSSHYIDAPLWFTESSYFVYEGIPQILCPLLHLWFLHTYYLIQKTVRRHKLVTKICSISDALKTIQKVKMNALFACLKTGKEVDIVQSLCDSLHIVHPACSCWCKHEFAS